jgi:transcriptional regulator with XRE-family HTH domain
MPMTAEKTTFGERLRAARLAAKLSQGELAVRSKVSVSLIAQMEQGRTGDPKLSTVRRLALALGVTIDSLAGEG